MKVPLDISAMDGLPGGLTAEQSVRGILYRWRILPSRPGAIIFLVVVGLMFFCLGLLGMYLIAGSVFDWLGLFGDAFKDYGSFNFVIMGIVLCFILFKTWNYFATILFGKCFLALSPSELDYEVFVFGLKSKAKSVKMPAADILSLTIKDPGRKGLEVQRRSGTPFYPSLQRFSEGELLRIRKRFLADLGRKRSAQLPNPGCS
jgi:hypothetical protein